MRLLHTGDTVTYFTVKRAYFGQPPHRRLTGVLRVIAEERSHLAADRWYERHGLPLPRNIMVPRNPPLPLTMTEGGYRQGNQIILPASEEDAPRILAHWDGLYQTRRLKVQDVRICEPLLINVMTGLKFGDELVQTVFGKAGFPNTQWRPQGLGGDVLSALLNTVGATTVADSILGTAALPNVSEAQPALRGKDGSGSGVT